MNKVEKVINDLNVAKHVLCNPQILNFEMNIRIGQAVTDAIALLKEQESIKQKMWNALYSEEDKFEKQYAGTDKNNDWFFVYRPWLQRGFEIAIEAIAKQEGQ